MESEFSVRTPLIWVGEQLGYVTIGVCSSRIFKARSVAMERAASSLHFSGCKTPGYLLRYWLNGGEHSIVSNANSCAQSCRTSIPDRMAGGRARNKNTEVLAALARGKARLPPTPPVSKTQTIEGFCRTGKRLGAAGWLSMCGTLFLPLSFLPQSSSSFTMLTEFTGQNNPFFFNWKILSKCHNVLMSFELHITGP